LQRLSKQGVDGRGKPGHDSEELSKATAICSDSLVTGKTTANFAKFGLVLDISGVANVKSSSDSKCLREIPCSTVPLRNTPSFSPNRECINPNRE
jgi:hypothetical protein